MGNSDDKTHEEDIGIPKELRVKRKYTLSDKALQQRRDASQQPKPGMQGRRNAWKHGRHAASFVSRLKPCKTTCRKYPCNLVAEGTTRAGDDCLELGEMLNIIRAVHQAIKSPKEGAEAFNEISAVIIGNNLNILEMMQEDIMRDGTMVKSLKYDKKGNLIQEEYKPHPSLTVLPKMISDLGMSPDNFMITPKAKDRSSNEKEAVRAITDVLGTAGGKLSSAAKKEG